MGFNLLSVNNITDNIDLTLKRIINLVTPNHDCSEGTIYKPFQRNDLTSNL